MLMQLLACLALSADDPALVLRSRSLDGLIADFRHVAKRAGREEDAKRFEEMMRSRTGPKGLEGVQTKKPLGLTLDLAAKLPDSRVWLLLPIADEKAFLDFLARIEMKPKKEADGSYKLRFEGVPLYDTALFRFAHGYLYGTMKLSDASAIPAADKLPKPESLLGEGDAALSLVLRIDRVPEAIRKVAVSFIGLNLGAEKDKAPEGETPAQKVLREATIDEATARLKAVLLEGKTLRAELAIDPKKDELSLSASLDGAKGSALAKDIAALGKLSSVAAGVLGKGAVFSASARLELPEAMRKAAAGVVDEAVSQALDRIAAHEREVAEPAVKAVAPTLRAGLLDAALQLVPGKGGKMVFLASARVQDGAKVEAAMRKLLDALPEKSRKGIKLEAHKGIHAVENKSAHETFGEGPGYFAFKGDALLLAFGEEGLPALKAALEAKPATASPLVLEASLEKLAPLIPHGKEAAKDTLKDGGTVRLSLAGGERLEARFTASLSAIAFASALDKLKEK
ncbi:MAG: hypothetical protein K2W96_22310 [Gemmataceae bacterium]|nr:hypothetical protein [Gemmataceae bacterium]